MRTHGYAFLNPLNLPPEGDAAAPSTIYAAYRKEISAVRSFQMPSYHHRRRQASDAILYFRAQRNQFYDHENP